MGTGVSMDTADETRVEHALDVVALGEELRHDRRVGDVPLHPDVQGPQAAQDQEAVQRARHPAHRVLEEAEPLADRIVPRDGDADDRVRVAAEVLRRRMEHDVGAEGQRVLERR